MHDLWLYDRMCRIGGLNYRLKIMLVAFLGTHVPLIAVGIYIAATHSATFGNSE